MQTLRDLLLLIDPYNRDRCLNMWENNEELFRKAKGSSHNHQAWEGGYLDHVTEVMNIAVYLYEAMEKMRPLPFKIGDAMLVLFLHDLEKPWKQPGWTKHDRELFRWNKIEEWEIEMSVRQMIALDYVEGEGDDYSPSCRVMSELAAFCHMCDVASARIWHDKPEPTPR